MFTKGPRQATNQKAEVEEESQARVLFSLLENIQPLFITVSGNKTENGDT